MIYGIIIAAVGLFALFYLFIFQRRHGDGNQCAVLRHIFAERANFANKPFVDLYLLEVFLW